MRIAIHQSKRGFSSDWITYCKEKGIPFKIVDCYHSDIIKHLQDCDVLLWHHHHMCSEDKLFAQQLLFAVEQSGRKVFPNFNSGWHFDDKLGQKYLLEAIGAPLVPTFIFYSKEEANRWLTKATFPLVFKLRCGAGSSNVRLVRKKSDANRLVVQAFGSGFASYDKWENLRDTYLKYNLKRESLKGLLKSVARLFISTQFSRAYGPEKGYMLFQEFIPNNDSDTRVIVIYEKAFAIKRVVRKNDFRASGSGVVNYNKEEIDIRCIKIAFDVFDKLRAQCLAFDFIFDKNKNPLIVEINYGFAKEGYLSCPGYWNKELNWISGKFNPLHWIIDGIERNLHPNRFASFEEETIGVEYASKKNNANKHVSSMQGESNRLFK